MGFPSPAMDYQEQRMTIDVICGVDNNCRVIETSCGWAVINVQSEAQKEGIRCWLAWTGETSS
ncbi:Uncharacterised protein [Enterobacter asburiae]|uniref:Uncharacterized protein n=1 Tax=Enterobacter asburiae TaxID=61645 RepID=A0A376FMD6_ENTAS|nr:Uncharacterised protein [Enterobacter asburiae]